MIEIYGIRDEEVTAVKDVGWSPFKFRSPSR
jgi:hypothetical protein